MGEKFWAQKTKSKSFCASGTTTQPTEDNNITGFICRRFRWDLWSSGTQHEKTKSFHLIQITLHFPTETAQFRQCVLNCRKLVMTWRFSYGLCRDCTLLLVFYGIFPLLRPLFCFPLSVCVRGCGGASAWLSNLSTQLISPAVFISICTGALPTPNHIVASTSWLPHAPGPWKCCPGETLVKLHTSLPPWVSRRSIVGRVCLRARSLRVHHQGRNHVPIGRTHLSITPCPRSNVCGAFFSSHVEISELLGQNHFAHC